MKLILLALSITALSGCAAPPPLEPAREASFVGREACAECHPEQVKQWRGSHHDRAMQVADPSTVLGNFDDTTFTYTGATHTGSTEVTTTFFSLGDEYWVRTDDPDGEIADFRVAYVFGVEPLQQYLLELPDGRLQALSVSWDARPANEGGQRWFHLYPDEGISAGDVLHWTGPLLNWNYMCAECHSTNLEKNYQLAENRYETTFSEIDVSCEACHGPGSNHVDQAKNGDDPSLGLVAQLKDVDTAFWTLDPESGNARRSAPRKSRTEIETCGRCHARRTPAAEYQHGQPLAESHHIALLDEGLYHADGQIDDEVYVYGSFLQSKMYHQGVTCGDCHDPHDAGLITTGNAVCTRCHMPAKFETPEHHHHSPGGSGSQCVDCHMPAKNYMVVDPRRDHSFRVPRPDLSLKIGTPNACTDCHQNREGHQDHDDQWAAEAVTAWYGPERSETFHYGEALHAGRQWRPEAARMLRRVADDPQMPGIARASAVSLLARYPGPATSRTLKAAGHDGDPLVRSAVAGVLEALEAEERLSSGLPLLQDPVLTVRLQAARALAGMPAELISVEQAPILELALAEYVDVQRLNADRAETHVDLGALHMRSGEPELAEKAYREAIRIDPSYVFSYINLADLRRAQGRDDEGEGLLRQAIGMAPESGDTHHALGLLRVRQERMDEALESLARAARLRPEEPRYAYAHGVALQTIGEVDRGLAVLEDASRRFPAHRDLLHALIAIHRDRGDFDAVADSARRLLTLTPWDPGIQQVLEQLQQGPQSGGARP